MHTLHNPSNIRWPLRIAAIRPSPRCGQASRFSAWPRAFHSFAIVMGAGVSPLVAVVCLVHRRMGGGSFCSVLACLTCESGGWRSSVSAEMGRLGSLLLEGGGISGEQR